MYRLTLVSRRGVWCCNVPNEAALYELHRLIMQLSTPYHHSHNCGRRFSSKAPAVLHLANSSEPIELPAWVRYYAIWKMKFKKVQSIEDFLLTI